ncbi:hypothetical protein RI129_009330 [Pyrocoelia pectoralis]|uniref:SUN domain-containing protein n=1 Tax=Pyrocoelia pectoralis TaxID=417401 RepID=A0AAN7V5V2_9COLE
MVFFYIEFSEVSDGIYEIREFMLRGGNGGAYLNRSSEGNTKKRCGNRGGGSRNVNDAVRKALEEYDADKTTRADFALESAGGTIVSVRDTEQYEPRSRSCTFFGLPICPSSNGPRQIIQPSILPGECWAFKGSTGTAIIKLLGRVHIDGISLEHISKTISPTGLIDTAPNEFVIMGLEEEEDEGDLLGSFTYDINGPTLQIYQVFPVDKSYPLIEFSVLSNHGHPLFTCVYRLRVHGTLDDTDHDDDDL